MTFQIASRIQCITYASKDVEEIERCVNIDLDRISICYTKHD